MKEVVFDFRRTRAELQPLLIVERVSNLLVDWCAHSESPALQHQGHHSKGHQRLVSNNAQSYPPSSKSCSRPLFCSFESLLTFCVCMWFLVICIFNCCHLTAFFYSVCFLQHICFSYTFLRENIPWGWGEEGGLYTVITIKLNLSLSGHQREVTSWFGPRFLLVKESFSFPLLTRFT